MGTLKISHKNFLLQLYLWAWEVDPDKLNVCKLIWGIVFLPIGVLGKNKKRPFHYLSPVAAAWLMCLFIPSLWLGKYASASVFIVLALCSVIYNYVRREAIIKKCEQQEAKYKAEKANWEAEKAKREAEDDRFSPRTERILLALLSPIFWAIDIFDGFSSTRSGSKITGFFSLCYHFVRSKKQKTCLLIEIE